MENKTENKGTLFSNVLGLVLSVIVIVTGVGYVWNYALDNANDVEITENKTITVKDAKEKEIRHQALRLDKAYYHIEQRADAFYVMRQLPNEDRAWSVGLRCDSFDEAMEMLETVLGIETRSLEQLKAGTVILWTGSATNTTTNTLKQ